MAQGTQNAAELWLASAASCGFTVHDGQVWIGVSGDEGDGYIVPLPAPDYFAAIRDEGTRDNTFRALAGHGLRVGQAKIKSADKPTWQVAADGVASALNGGYKPARSRDNDIADTEAAKMFAAYVAEKARASDPAATDGDIAETVKEYSGTDRGKELIAGFRAKVLTDRTYKVARRGENKPKAKVVKIAEL